MLDRLVELDEAGLRDVPITGWHSPDEIVDLLTGLLAHWLGPARSRTLARLELHLDAARHTELTPELRAANLRFRDRAAAGLRAAGLPDPDESARILLAQLDGLLYDALARPFAGGDAPVRLRRAVEVVVRGVLGGR